MSLGDDIVHIRTFDQWLGQELFTVTTTSIVDTDDPIRVNLMTSIPWNVSV